MNLDRRQFLKGFTAATAGALLLPERKIWALDKTMVRSAPVIDHGVMGWFDYQKNQIEMRSTMSGLIADERIHPGDMVVVDKLGHVRLGITGDAMANSLRMGVAICSAEPGRSVSLWQHIVETIPAESADGSLWRTYAIVDEIPRLSLQ